ncbi:GNAT family N-acetyltransferase [Lutibacter citreus]|uniref:GNAT family N-acetyltransferase n=1 Tax=Lutibacter citreus TaxID=2138210 RepID=UPI0013008109|nr:GNAT family N-acetyltransferase [Lutibacter citreus]
MIFETERLLVRKLNIKDSDLFYEMMSNPKVMDPIPQKVFSRSESDAKLKVLISPEKGMNLKIWGLLEKRNNSFIGICGFLKNNENDDEIAYRLIERYWGVGYGTEIAKALVEYSFNILKVEKITADVNIENEKSAKILQKFMNPVKEFFNKSDSCTDRRYAITKTEYYTANSR